MSNASNSEKVPHPEQPVQQGAVPEKPPLPAENRRGRAAVRRDKTVPDDLKSVLLNVYGDAVREKIAGMGKKRKSSEVGADLVETVVAQVIKSVQEHIEKTLPDMVAKGIAEHFGLVGWEPKPIIGRGGRRKKVSDAASVLNQQN